MFVIHAIAKGANAPESLVSEPSGRSSEPLFAKSSETVWCSEACIAGSLGRAKDKSSISAPSFSDDRGNAKAEGSNL